MRGKSVVFMVATRCRPDQEEKFNKWYNAVHAPMVLKSRGAIGVTRYKLASVKADEGEYPAYLAIYEFEDTKAWQEFWTGPVLTEAREEMKGTWGDDGFDVEWRVVYEPLWTSFK
ncbi:DUF4286 family protein [Chloroflexota bacterium]